MTEQAEKPRWVWFSTRKTIEDEIPSVTAILETIIAVPLYWWIALKAGVLWPLGIAGCCGAAGVTAIRKIR